MKAARSCSRLIHRRAFDRNCVTSKSRASRPRIFSSEVPVAMEVDAVAEAGSLISRHGKGDGVITLNVGGKEFVTLRSTIQDNPILWNHVRKAEANEEFLNGAVFIDRDPTHFNLILQHLRNRADIKSNKDSFTSAKRTLKEVLLPSSFRTAGHALLGKKDVLIQIPKEREALRNFYTEARYFQIRELEAILCSSDWFTQAASFVGSGATNPFYAATQAITNARRALVATSGFGIMLGAQNEELFKNFRGLVSDTTKVLRGEKLEDPSPENEKSKK